jgi:hypothetical protein
MHDRIGQRIQRKIARRAVVGPESNLDHHTAYMSKYERAHHGTKRGADGKSRKRKIFHLTRGPF